MTDHVARRLGLALLVVTASFGYASRMEVNSTQAGVIRWNKPTTPYRNVFMATGIPPGFEGTFLPLTYIENLKTTRSHIQSLRKTRSLGTYGVIVITEEGTFSDDQYDDKGHIREAEFAKSWTSSDKSRLIDSKGNRYVRISKSTFYADAVEKYYMDVVIGTQSYADSNGNTLVPTSKGSIKLNEKEYRILLYGIRGANDTMDIIFNNEEKSMLGIESDNEAIRIYKITLKDSGGPQLDIDERTAKLLYSFQK